MIVKNSVEMLSNPQDALFGKLSINLEYCSSTLFNANLQFMLIFTIFFTRVRYIVTKI